MAHLGTFHRLYIAFNEFLSEDESINAIQLMKMRQWAGMMNIPRSVPRACGYSNVVTELAGNDDYFREHFRVSRHIFELILERIEHALTSEHRGGNDPVSPEKQLSIFLWYLANQSSMRGVSQLFGVSQSTVHGLVMKVSRAIASLHNRIIRWPDAQRRQEIAATVQQNTGFPGVIGFLDGTHIRLSAAIGGDNDYYNRKGFPSMQLQIVVDHDLTIISAYTGWPGCTHDARVLRNSSLFQNAEGGQLFSQGQCLFADNAYPLRNWLITPFRNVGNQLTNQQRRFNAKFSGQRQAVERAIGHLKGRFRRLREVPFHSAEEVCNLILAACICHNICVLCEDDVEMYIEHDGQLHPNNYPNIHQNGHHGVARRLQLLNVV